MSDGPGNASFREIEVGDVVTVRLPENRPRGHEQEGYRPAVVIGVPSLAGTPRFDLLLLAPFTTDKNQSWARSSPLLYPRFPRGVANLRSPSICLLDQSRALDRRRVVRRRGRMDSGHFARIREGLMAVCGQRPAD